MYAAAKSNLGDQSEYTSMFVETLVLKGINANAANAAFQNREKIIKEKLETIVCKKISKTAIKHTSIISISKHHTYSV